MHNDTSRKGTRTKICFAPVTILKASSKLQLFSCSSQGPGPAGNNRESRAEDGRCSGASIPSELLGLHPASPSTKPHPGTAPWTPLSQHSDTDRGQGDVPGFSQMEGAFPRHRLHFEAFQSWDLSGSRLCEQTIVSDWHWLFLSLFSHFLKSLT